MTDPLISRYLPVVHGHIVNKYRWVEERGNCLFTVEDLQQVAAITLIKLAAKWDHILAGLGKTRDGDGALFWAYLKNEIKAAVSQYYRDHGRRGADDESIDEESETWGAVRTQVYTQHETASGSLTLNEIVDFYELMPRRDKILLALRYYDELPWKQVADILSANIQTTRNLAGRATDRWRVHARNMYLEFPVDEGPRYPRPWEPPESLETYLRARHRKDLPEYLWFVTTAFRQDVAYLSDIFHTGPLFQPGSTTPSLSPFQQTQVDVMLAAGMTQSEIARRMNVPRDTVHHHASRRFVA